MTTYLFCMLIGGVPPLLIILGAVIESFVSARGAVISRIALIGAFTVSYIVLLTTMIMERV